MKLCFIDKTLVVYFVYQVELQKYSIFEYGITNSSHMKFEYRQYTIIKPGMNEKRGIQDGGVCCGLAIDQAPFSL